MVPDHRGGEAVNQAPADAPKEYSIVGDEPMTTHNKIECGLALTDPAATEDEYSILKDWLGF